MKNPLNVTICVLNSKYVHSSLAPWCLLAGVNTYCEYGITATVVEGTINENLKNIANRIVLTKPNVIGFSCYVWNITATRKLIHLIKSLLPETVVVLGGPEVSYNAEEILREEPYVKYIISGEGEKPFALLLNAISDNETALNIPGVCFRDQNQLVIVPPFTPEDDPPSPYTENYFQALNGRIAYLETSRGCPFSCAFCLSGRCGGVRYFDLERVKKEIIHLANSGTQTIKLIDRTFNSNRNRANSLFRFIIENYGTEIPKGVCFHFEIGGDLLDEQAIRILSEAPIGSMQLEIGLQSFYEKTLLAIRRKTDVQRLKDNIRCIVKKGNMHIHIDLIAGLPYEDINRFEESFNTAYSLNPNMLQLGFLKLLHGSPMRESPDQFPCRYKLEPPYEVIETPWLSQKEILELHKTEDALERLHNSGRFRRTLAYLLHETGLNPFELFSGFGEFAAEKGTERIPLDDYTALLFEYFGRQNRINKTILRDIMVCDRLATNSTGKLPQVLRIQDPALKKAKKELVQTSAYIKKGVKFGYALLYSENCMVYVVYREQNPVTGEYPLFKIPFDFL